MKSAKVANVFNSNVQSVFQSLDLLNLTPEPYDQVTDSVERIIQGFSHHPSIIKIKQKIKILTKFSFTPSNS